MLIPYGTNFWGVVLGCSGFILNDKQLPFCINNDILDPMNDMELLNTKFPQSRSEILSPTSSLIVLSSISEETTKLPSLCEFEWGEAGSASLTHFLTEEFLGGGGYGRSLLLNVEEGGLRVSASNPMLQSEFSKLRQLHFTVPAIKFKKVEEGFTSEENI
jgi:hypothetical protein